MVPNKIALLFVELNILSTQQVVKRRTEKIRRENSLRIDLIACYQVRVSRDNSEFQTEPLPIFCVSATGVRLAAIFPNNAGQLRFSSIARCSMVSAVVMLLLFI